MLYHNILIQTANQLKLNDICMRKKIGSSNVILSLRTTGQLVAQTLLDFTILLNI